MLRSYFTIALRHLRKQKGYTLLNLSGLALGLAAGLLVLLYVHDELRFDRFHAHADRIHRINMLSDFGLHGGTPWLPAEKITADFPEVEAMARFSKIRVRFRQGEEVVQEEAFYADPEVLEIFSFPLQQGDPAQALRAPHSLVLTPEKATQYFGGADPMGQTLATPTGEVYTVTGVLEPLPAQSHLAFDFLIASSTAADANPWQLFSESFVLLQPGADAAAVGTKLTEVASAEYLGWMLSDIAFETQPLTRIYLHSAHHRFTQGRQSDMQYVYIFGVIAAFLLLIAAINYMNLATARSLGRAREVGMRKVLGAGRGQLVGQFLGEALLLALGALVVALALVELALPFFNDLTQKHIEVRYVGEGGLLPWFLLLTLGMGLLAGSYPALVLSRFAPAGVLKRLASGVQGGRLRRALVVTQFAISAALIIATVVIQQQLHYMQHKNLGFDQEQVVVLQLRGNMTEQAQVVRSEILHHPGVEQVSLTSGTPISHMMTTREDEATGAQQFVHHLSGDEHLLATVGFSLVAGRNFDPALATDSGAVLLNETAVRAFGLPENPLGETVVERTVIGVVQDFHMSSLHEPIAPMLLKSVSSQRGQRGLSTILVRLRPDAAQPVLAHLETIWKQFAPDHPFTYAFLDDNVQKRYASERRLAQFFGIFSALVVLIAALGLFGLAAFTAQQRTKEIGIRKVLGASIGGIVVLLSKEFVRLIGWAFVIAAPLAYLAMDRWLQDFAYHIDLGAGTFLLAGGGLLLLAWLTVSYQSVRAALANPVQALRYE